MEETLTQKKGESNCIYQHYKGKRLQENNKKQRKNNGGSLIEILTMAKNRDKG